MKWCIEPGCTARAWKDRSYCGVHQNIIYMQKYGPCPVHPDRPILLPGKRQCATCARRAYRAQHLTTDQAHTGTASRELAGVMDEVIEQVLKVRKQLARFLRTQAEADEDTWLGYTWLTMVSRRLSEPHQRYIYAKINRDAPPDERIPMLRSKPT